MTDATPCTKCGQPHNPAKCQAHSKRTGRQCGKDPMKGQHVCRSHGGTARQNREAAERRQTEQRAEQAVATFGLPRTIDPHQALLEELHRTAGAVAWLDHMVRNLEEDDVVWGKTREKTGGDDRGTTHEAGTNAWVQLWERQRKHLVAVAKECVSAGIEERRVELEQARVRLQAESVQAGLEAAELTDEQRTTVIRVMLEKLRVNAALGS